MHDYCRSFVAAVQESTNVRTLHPQRQLRNSCELLSPFLLESFQKALAAETCRARGNVREIVRSTCDFPNKGRTGSQKEVLRSQGIVVKAFKAGQNVPWKSRHATLHPTAHPSPKATHGFCPCCRGHFDDVGFQPQVRSGWFWGVGSDLLGGFKASSL